MADNGKSEIENREIDAGLGDRASENDRGGESRGGRRG